MLKSKYILLMITVLFFAARAKSQTFVFAQLQGSPTMNTAGWNLNGAAFVGDTPGDADANGDELILTNPINSTSGGIFYSQPINLTQCQRWRADFEFRMFDGNGADGLALCFLDVPPTGFVVGGGVGIPGSANGLKVVFDTYENQSGTEANPQIEIRYGVGYNQYLPPFNGQPTVLNTGGQLNFLRSNNYQSASVRYDNGNIEVYVNNVLWLTGFYNINFTGYLGFTSGTGAFNDRNSIRNVTIYTEQAPSDAGPNAGVSYCSGNGNSVQIGSTPNVNYVYTWSPSTGLNQTNIANPTVNLVNNTNAPIIQNYTVTTSLASNPGVCPSTDNITVTINPTPTSTFSVSNTQACVGAPITVTYTGNMNGAANFTWNFNGGTIVSGSGIGPYQISWPTTGEKHITLSVSKYGCTSAQFADTVNIAAIPTSTFTKPNEICEGAEVSLTYTGSAASTATYVWNFDGANIVSGTNQGPYQLKWMSSGQKNISLTVTENGCSSPITQDTIRVYPIPVAQLIVPAAMCAGDTILVGFAGDTTVTATTQFTWSAGTMIPIPSVPSPGFWWTNNSPGNYIFTFALNDHGCQSDTATDSITVHAIPTATFTASPEVCLGEKTILTYIGTGSASANYAWNYSPATLSTGSGQGPLEVEYAAAGNYNVTLTVTENNCVSQPETLATIVHAIPTSTFNLATGICVGQNSTLTYTGTGTAGATYDWNFDGVEVVSGSNAGPYVFGDANLGTFTISLQVTENNCASPTSIQTFDVLPTPDVDFSGTPLIGCNPLPVDFTNLTPPQTGIQYVWSFGDGGSSTQENPSYIYANAGNFTTSLTATNGYGCTATETKNNYVDVTAQPIAGFSVLPENVTMDNPVVNVVDNSQFAQTYSYSMGEGTTYTQAQPTHTYISEGEYEVIQIVSNSLGCTDKASIIVNVYPYTNVYIPNTFTPTQDGINEIWMPVISYLAKYEISVYDRWGWLVFTTDDLFTGWNGKYRNYGKEMEAGLYSYRISFKEFTGKSRVLMGHVTLVR